MTEDPTTAPARAPAKSLLRSASVYWLSNALSSGLGFLLLPVLTRYLSPADYGAMAMFQLIISILDPIVGLNVHAAISRRFYDLTPSELAAYVGTSLLILVPTTAVAAVTCLVAGGFLEEITFLPTRWILVALLVSLSNALVNSALAFLQVAVRPWTYGAFQTARTLLGLGLALWLVVGRGLDWHGRAWAMALSGAGSAVGALLVFRAAGLLRATWRPEHARHMLRYGIPLIPHALGAVAMVVTDRLFLAHMIDLKSAGLYSVGYQLGLVVGLLQDGFNRAWVPWLFDALGSADLETKRRIVRFTYAYDLGLLALAGAVTLVASPVVSHVLPEKFAGAWPFVFWIALGYAFDGMYKMPANYIFYAERTSWLGWVTASAALLNVPLTYALIRLNGSIGAAQATTAAFFLMWVGTWALAQRCYPMPWASPFGRSGA